MRKHDETVFNETGADKTRSRYRVVTVRRVRYQQAPKSVGERFAPWVGSNVIHVSDGPNIELKLASAADNETCVNG